MHASEEFVSSYQWIISEKKIKSSTFSIHKIPNYACVYHKMIGLNWRCFIRFNFHLENKVPKANRIHCHPLPLQQKMSQTTSICLSLKALFSWQQNELKTICLHLCREKVTLPSCPLCFTSLSNRQSIADCLFGNYENDHWTLLLFVVVVLVFFFAYISKLQEA